MQGQLLLILTIAVAAVCRHADLPASAPMRHPRRGRDQVISGTAINMLTPAVAIYVACMIQQIQQIGFVNTFRIVSVPLLGNIPVLGPCSSKYLPYHLPGVCHP